MGEEMPRGAGTVHSVSVGFGVRATVHWSHSRAGSAQVMASVLGMMLTTLM